MTLDELLGLLQTNEQISLSPVKEKILRQTWQGTTYAEMAEQLSYEAGYLKKVGFELWRSLSQMFGQPINKSNLRSQLEPQPLTSTQQQQIAEVRRRPFKALIPAGSTSGSLRFPTGPVPLDSAFYVERPPLETLAAEEMEQPGGLVRIKGPKQMGKSSLLLRLLYCAEQQGYRTAYIDFHPLNPSLLESPDIFLRWFCVSISEQLGLVPQLEDYWDNAVGSAMGATLFLKQYLLANCETPLVLILNEVDRIFEHRAIAKVFFPLLRSWYEEARRRVIMQQIRLVVTYSTEAYIPLDVNQSPFNVGLPIQLPGFSLAQLQDLAQRYGLEWAAGEQGQETLKPLHKLTDGHPFLTRLAFYHLCQGRYESDRNEGTNDSATASAEANPLTPTSQTVFKPLKTLVAEATTLSGIYGDHLRRHWTTVGARPELAEALKQVVSASPGTGVTLAPRLAYDLASLGLVLLQGNQVFPSCDLYRVYFGAQLQ